MRTGFSESDGSPGRIVQCTDEGVVLDGDYTENFYPWVRQRCEVLSVGYHGMGIPESVREQQFALDEVDNLILESNRFSTDGARLVTVIPPLLSSQPSNYAMIPNFNQNQCGSANGPPTFTSPPGFGVNGNQVITVWTGCLNR